MTILRPVILNTPRPVILNEVKNLKRGKDPSLALRMTTPLSGGRILRRTAPQDDMIARPVILNEVKNLKREKDPSLALRMTTPLSGGKLLRRFTPQDDMTPES